MKLTQRQLDKIAGLIDEEAKVRKELHEGMYNSRKNSVISEALMFEASGELENLPSEFVKDIEGEFSELSQDVLSSKVRVMVYRILSGYMKHYGYNMSPSQWIQELDGFDEIYEAEMEFVSDVASAITEYGRKVAEVAVMSIGPSEDSSKEDLEPRYSEYE
jgi:hypothetical protein